MRRTVKALLVVTLAASGLWAADNRIPASYLTVAQIVERNASARGGADAWRAVTSITVKGRMDAGKQVSLPFVLTLARPRKSRLEIEFKGETAVQVYDGANGWKLRPFLGRNEVEPFTSAELQLASRQAELDGPIIGYAAKGTRIDLDGIDKVDGRDAYKLKLTLKNGDVQHVWIDAKTFLEAKTDELRRIDGKMHTMETYYREYKSVQGLMMPSLYETTVEGVKGFKGLDKITVESFVVNSRLNESAFAKPQLTTAAAAQTR